MSPGDSGGDQTRSPVVALPRQSDPVSSASWERLRCPESPRCVDSSPDHLRSRNRKTVGDKCVGKLHNILSKSNILSSETELFHDMKPEISPIHPNTRHIIQVGLQ